MNKQAPSIGQLITIAGFALSCFGLLLFVWVAFGGPSPLAATGYHLNMPLKQIGQLAEQSEVKISGVEVGRVNKIELGEDSEAGTAIVTLDIEPEYAPVPADTRAILRAKSLLGEAYVELTPGDKRDGMLEDGDSLPPAQVAESVQLDEIYRTFDAKTRAAFQSGAIDNAIAMNGRGETLNQTLGVLPDTLSELTDVLVVLDEHDKELSKLIKNTGVVFDAISKRQGQLSSLIRNTNTVFSTTAEREADLTSFFRIFPTFLRESRATQERLGDFATTAKPVMDKLVPVAEQLSPTIQASADLAPQSHRLYKNLKPVIRKAPKSLPQLRSFLDQDATKLLARIPDYFAEFNPLIQSASYYRREIAAFIGNAAVVTNATATTAAGQSSAVRAGISLGPETFAAFPTAQSASTRTNPYTIAGSNLDIGSGGLKSFNTANCSSGLNAQVPAWSSLTPIQQAQYQNNTRYLDALDSEELYESAIEFGLRDALQMANVPAPGCTGQGTFPALGDPSQPASRYQHVFRQP